MLPPNAGLFAKDSPKSRYRPVQPNATISLGRAWSTNSVNCVSFRSEAVLTVGDHQYGAFYRPDGHVDIFARELRGGVRHKRLRVERLPRDAHQSISMTVDAAGFLHLAYGAHASHLTYARSEAPHSIDAFLHEEWSGGPEQEVHNTYPMFVREPEGGLNLLYRDGGPEGGDIRIRRWNADEMCWTEDKAPLILGRAGERGSWAGPYLNRLVMDDAGKVHAFIVWRVTPRLLETGLVNNVGVDLVAFRPGLHEVESASGFRLHRPAGLNTSERVVAVPHGSNLINQAGAGLLPDGTPCAVTYWAEADGVPQFRFIHRRGTQWRHTPASDFVTSFKLEGKGTLPLPHSRPGVVVAEDGRVLVVFRSKELDGALVAHVLSPPDYSLDEAVRLLLVDRHLGFYEPVIDYSAWKRRGVLSMYVQSCAQERGDDDDPDGQGVPCQLIEWSKADLLTCPLSDPSV